MVRIGITTYYEKKDENFTTLIPYDYLSAVIEQNAVPVMIPVVKDLREIDRYIDLVDGILLSGGEDIDPALYGEENTGLSREVCRIRDSNEMYIITEALKKGMPLLGICRGMQILNVALGGTLYQDIGSQIQTGIKHQHVMNEGNELHHDVNIVKDSALGRLYGRERIPVNSRHHQGIKRLAEGLIVNATSDDGIIEGFEDHCRNIMAVQWHPENITAVGDSYTVLFRDIVGRSGRRRNDAGM